jgi:DNA-binding IclR family transcriptional regulator
MSPTANQILAQLRDEPDGLTSGQVADRLNFPAMRVRSTLSRMAAYGWGVQKTRVRRGAAVIWRAKMK